MGINSVDKLLEYVSRVSKEPIYVNGEMLLSIPIRRVLVKDQFFAKDGCNVCGRCCLNENNAYTAEGIVRLNAVLNNKGEDRAAINAVSTTANDLQQYIELSEKLNPFNIEVNGRQIPIWDYLADKGKDAQRFSYAGRPENLPRCHWLDLTDPSFQPCSIHLARSVTCGIPHMRFYHTTNSINTSITVQQYGRNHNIGCPITFEPYSEEHEQNVQNRVVWLERLNEVANDFCIETWLPEILQKIKEGRRTAFTVEAPKKAKLF